MAESVASRLCRQSTGIRVGHHFPCCRKVTRLFRYWEIETAKEYMSLLTRRLRGTRSPIRPEEKISEETMLFTEKGVQKQQTTTHITG